MGAFRLFHGPDSRNTHRWRYRKVLPAYVVTVDYDAATRLIWLFGGRGDLEFNKCTPVRSCTPASPKSSTLVCTESPSSAPANHDPAPQSNSSPDQKSVDTHQSASARASSVPRMLSRPSTGACKRYDTFSTVASAFRAVLQNCIVKRI